MNSNFLVVSIFMLTSVITAQKMMGCFVCNSSTMKICAHSIYNRSSVLLCQNENDTCGIIIKGTDTIRGCSEEIGKGDLNAEPCNTMFCNTQTFPPKRLQCNQCTDCSTLSNETLSACQHYSATDECYTDVINEQKFSRGCMSDNPDNLSQFVVKCNSTDCNNINVVDTLNCTECKSDEDVNCMKIDDDPACEVTVTKNCSIKTLLGRQKNAKCFTYIKDGKVERGCTEKETNLAPNEKFCSNSDYCNNHCLEPIKCLQCDPSDPKCEKPNELISQLCKNDIFCSACASPDGNITRACGVRNHGTCTICQDKDACNSQKFCYKCSSDTNPNCATWKDLSEIKLEICKDPNEACAVTLINGRTVERACKLQNQCKPPNCKICSEKDKCNEAPFPDDIQRCIQCSGEKCEKEQQKEKSVLCDIFDPNDSCYAYADKSGVAHRGCTSNAEEYRKCNQTGNCWTCNGNNCNTPRLLKCYSCLASRKDNCGKWTDPDSIDMITCQNPRQVCATTISGNQVKRGCEFPEAFTCEDGDASCQKCDQDNCNAGQVNKMPIRCLRCSGEAGCDKEQNKTKAILCGDNDAQCYAYTNSNGDVFRGCTNDANYNNCPKDIDGKCWTCNKDSCNNMKMPSCYTCSSGLNQNCATANDLSSIPFQLCPNPSDQCVSRLVNEALAQRGCQSLKEIDPDCGFNSKSCKICEDKENCNVDPIPREQFTCLECSGTDDCRTGQTPRPKTCLTYESCYMYRNASGKVLRGCIAAAEDLTTCEKESNSHCRTCKGDQCNTEKLRKCYTCESDASGACATFKSANPINSETCHNPEEVCAAVRIRDNVQRGCKLPESLNCKPGDPMCRSCTKDNCNDGSLAEYPAKCITCSGTDDCISETDPSKAQYCEKNVDGEPCFAYADNDGKVFRGCVADAEEYDKCQNSTNGHCWKCSGDGCNKITFSYCLSCKSAPGENCATLKDLNSIPSKVCQNPSQHCISQIVGKTVSRDCYSVSGSPTKCEFNTQNCKTCDKDNCNTEFVPRKQIECVQCMGSEDCRNEQDPKNAATCSTYESCVVSNAMGKITRGCISQFSDYIDCAKAGNGFCWACTGTTCNTPKVRSCYTCESDINGYCGTWNNPTLATSQTCQNPDEICATIITGKKVQRKCEKPENFDCPPGDVSCQKCDTDDCNAGLVHEKPKRCHTCSGTPDCRMEQIEGKDEDCPAYGKPDACFAYTDKNGQAFRGCMSSQKEYENCRKAGNGECWTCSGDGCNKDQILECFTCTTANNTNCGVWNDDNGTATQICKNPDQICTSYIKNGQTVRGCNKPDKTCTPLTGTCQNCKEDKCNAGSIPKVQLKCHQCSKTDACQEEQNSTSLSLCSSTETNPSCWAYADPTGKMVRGCTGDGTGFQECKDSGRCRICDTDGCNSFPYLSTQSLQCHKCNDAEACGWGQPNSTIAPCTNKIAYYLPEGCVRRRRDNNFERGCLFDLGICRGDKEFCAMCSSKAACNNENIITQSCIQCKTVTNDPECGKAQGIGGRECPEFFTTFEERGCYTRITDMQGIVERGCSQDLSAEDLSTCKADKDHKCCEYCDGQDCNNKKAPNSAPVAAGVTLGFVVLSSLVRIIL